MNNSAAKYLQSKTKQLNGSEVNRNDLVCHKIPLGKGEEPKTERCANTFQNKTIIWTNTYMKPRIKLFGRRNWFTNTNF